MLQTAHYFHLNVFSFIFVFQSNLHCLVLRLIVCVGSKLIPIETHVKTSIGLPAFQGLVNFANSVPSRYTLTATDSKSLKLLLGNYKIS